MKRLTTYKKASNVISVILFLSIIYSIIAWVWNFDTYHFKWVITTVILFIAEAILTAVIESSNKKQNDNN